MIRRTAPVRYCRCGAWYGDDPAGREAHKTVHGHYPIPMKENPDA